MNKIYIYITVLFFLCMQNAFCQDTLKIGNPQSLPIKRSELIPFNGKYDYSWSSALYTQEQLNGLDGQIDQIALHVSNNSNFQLKNQKIYARLTDKNSLESGYPDKTQFTLIYSGDLLFVGSGWKFINLTNKLDYVSGKNIEFLFDNLDGNSKDNCLSSNQSINCSPKFTFMESTTLKGKRDYMDKNFPQSCNMCETNLRIPIIIIHYRPCRVPTGSLSSLQNAVCSGQSTILSLTINGNQSLAYYVDWQISTDNGITWNSYNIIGGGLPQNQFQTPSIINNTLFNKIYMYRARIYNSGISQSGTEVICDRYTQPISIVIYPQPSVSISSNITPACLSTDNPLVLTPSSSSSSIATYNWKNSSGTIVSNSSSFTPILPESYQLEIILTNGCSAISNSIEVLSCNDYAVLKKELDGSFYNINNGQLLFTIKGDYSKTSLNYKIYNSSRTSYNTLPINSNVLENGDNRFIVNVSTLPTGYYILEVFNQKAEKLLLRFKK